MKYKIKKMILMNNIKINKEDTLLIKINYLNLNN